MAPPGRRDRPGPPRRHARAGVLAAAGFTLAALAAPTSCGLGRDARRAETCRRVLPALVPSGERPEILHVGEAGGGSVRVDYRLSGRSEARRRWIVCGFGAGSGLEGVRTESGPVSGASVYLLERYYLGTPEAAAADPLR